MQLSDTEASDVTQTILSVNWKCAIVSKGHLSCDVSFSAQVHSSINFRCKPVTNNLRHVVQLDDFRKFFVFSTKSRHQVAVYPTQTSSVGSSICRGFVVELLCNTLTWPDARAVSSCNRSNQWSLSNNRSSVAVACG